MRLTATDLKPRIGSLVAADVDTLLSGGVAAEIRKLLEERGVIVIRDAEIDDDQQLAISRSFGEVGDQGAGEVYKVSLDKRENPLAADIQYGTFSWHIDRTDTDVPPFASILSPKRLSARGGQTEFANTYAAYDDLPEADKALLDGLRVVHSLEAAFREFVPNRTEDQLARWLSVPTKIHPLVWRHRSGRKSLTLGMSAASVVGMDKAESDALLTRLMAWATQPEYVYTHEWSIGDLVIWNNTGTMHRVRPYDADSGRKLHRTTVLGDEPFDVRGADVLPVAVA